jgi:hypothetical protein
MTTAKEVAKLHREWDERSRADENPSQYWVQAPTVDDVPGIGNNKYAKNTFKRLMDQYPRGVPWPVEMRRAFVTQEPTDLATRWMLAEFTYMLGIDKRWLVGWLFLRKRFKSAYDAAEFDEIFDILDKCLKAESAKLKADARKKLRKMTITDMKKERFNPHATVKDNEKVERFHYDHLGSYWYEEYDDDIVWESHGLSFKPFPLTTEDYADDPTPIWAMFLALGV